MRILSKYDSVNNFVNSIKGGFESSWTGYDGEYFKDGKFYVDNTCLCKVHDDVMYLSQNSITPSNLSTVIVALNFVILSNPLGYVSL